MSAQHLLLLIIGLHVSTDHFYVVAKGTDYTSQQRFCPMRKNVCFQCIFGCWIQISFQNFSITHTFSVASDNVKAQAYICESLGACRRR